MSELIQGIGKMCAGERSEAIQLMMALDQGKCTELVGKNFNFDDWDVYFNPNSGYVFLSDTDYNTVMMNGGEVDLHISTPYGGVEGFFDEVMEDFLELHPEDQDYMRGLATEELREKFPVLKDGAFVRFGGKQ